jgi:DNA-binding transcriptional LysR family regulator
VCRQEGFTPRVASASDDIVVVQALVAAGVGVATQPGLALRAHADATRHPLDIE